MPGFNIPNAGGGAPADGLNPLSTQETARRHRWRFSIEPFSGNGGDPREIEIYAHKATRPTPEIDVVTVHHSQDEVYLPGKNRWAPIDISFYEIIKNNIRNLTAEYIYKWWSGDVIDISKSRIVGRSSQRIKRECTLTLLNSIGLTVYAYTLYGCWPEKVSPEDLNHSESAICELTVRLRYDKAIETSLDSNALLISDADGV